MRRRLWLLLVLWVVPCALFAQTSGRPGTEGDRELVAVMAVEALGATKPQATALGERLEEELLNTRRFRLVERQQSEKVLEEQAFQQSGCTSQECAVKVGQILGVRKLITSRITRVDERLWLFSAKIVDVETAETLRTASVDHEGNFVTLMNQGVAAMVAKLTGSSTAPLGSGLAQGPTMGPRVFTGHTKKVLSVAFSSDASTVASGSDDKTVRLWNVGTGGVSILSGHPDEVNAVAFFPGGTELAAGYDDGKAAIWDIRSGSQVRLLKGHSRAVLAVAVAPDGSTVATGSKDKSIRLWSAANPGMAPRVLTGHESAVNALAFVQGGAMLVSGGNDKVAILWNVASGQPGRRFVGHTGSVLAIAVSSDGKLLATGSEDDMVRVFNLQDGTLLRTFPNDGRDVRAVAFSGGRVVASGNNKILRIWDVASGNEAGVLSGHTNDVAAMAASLDGRWLATGAHDKTVRVWDVRR